MCNISWNIFVGQCMVFLKWISLESDVLWWNCYLSCCYWFFCFLLTTCLELILYYYFLVDFPAKFSTHDQVRALMTPATCDSQSPLFLARRHLHSADCIYNGATIDLQHSLLCGELTISCCCKQSVISQHVVPTSVSPAGHHLRRPDSQNLWVLLFFNWTYAALT